MNVPKVESLPIPDADAEDGGADEEPVPMIHKLWPDADNRATLKAAIPEETQRRIVMKLAAVPAIAAVLGLLPVLATGHANLSAAPPWALAAAFLAVLQLAYAGWMMSTPDWAAAWVLMAVCAVVTTLYGMLMTLAIIAPAEHPLILGLGEARRTAPAWCGLMLLLMGAATWYCGWTSTRWKRSFAQQGEE